MSDVVLGRDETQALLKRRAEDKRDDIARREARHIEVREENKLKRDREDDELDELRAMKRVCPSHTSPHPYQHVLSQPRREKQYGDWSCPACGWDNFARNKECFRRDCEERRPLTKLQRKRLRDKEEQALAEEEADRKKKEEKQAKKLRKKEKKESKKKAKKAKKEKKEKKSKKKRRRRSSSTASCASTDSSSTSYRSFSSLS